MKTIFTRKTKLGELVCKVSQQGEVSFYLNGDEIRRKTMIDIVPMSKIEKDPYYKSAIAFLKEHNAVGMWNAQIPLYGNEIELIKQAQREAKQTNEKKESEALIVFLSTCGWGDCPNLEWQGSPSTPTNQILSECKNLLTTGVDVDIPDQSDELILQKISKAKSAFEAKQAEKAERKRAAEKYIKTVPENVKKAFDECSGDPDLLPDDIDHPLYWAIRRYGLALCDLCD